MNVILVVWDATRAQNLSCYGYHRKTTPVLDRLLEEDDQAVVYNQAISASVWTLSAMSSLFTGTYVSRHQTHWGNITLSPEFPTLAERLRGKGLNTIGLSTNRAWASWHCNLDRGFDEFYETRGGILEHQQSPRIVHALNKVIPKIGHELRIPEPATRNTTSAAAKMIRSRAKEGQPFFLYAHYVEAHLKYVPPFRHRKFINWKKDFLKQFTVNMNAVAYLSGALDMEEDDFRLLEGLYDSAIHYQDHSLGVLLDSVKRLGIWDDTMIIVTADHGENIGDHGLMEHRYCLYDTLLRVPLIIKYPKSHKPVRKRELRLVQPHDIVPTVMELVDGANESRNGEFPDAYSLLSGESVRDFSLSEYLNAQLTHNLPQRFDLSRYDRSLQALRTERFKYIVSSDSKEEFYDIGEDPDENVDLIATPSYADDVGRLRKTFEECTRQFDVSGAEMPEIDPRIEEDAAIQERLKSLGYLE